MTRFTPVDLGGGSGTRLWPFSRDSAPKPFAPLAGDQSLLPLTRARQAWCGTPVVCVAAEHHEAVLFLVSKNQPATIPRGEAQRLHNPGQLDLGKIEVRSGSHHGEDGTVRLQGSCGRTAT